MPHDDKSRSDWLSLKTEKLLDMIRRASANGTAKEVAAAIAPDWIPIIEIDEQGKAEVVIHAATSAEGKSAPSSGSANEPRR
jgi:hypothetical protein